MFRPRLLPSRATTLAGCLSLFALAQVQAGSPPDTRIQHTINGVRIVEKGQAAPRPAKAGESLAGSAAIQTASFSRAELQIQDRGLIRLGADTIFAQKADRPDLGLERGTMLLQTPWTWRGRTIRAGGVTASLKKGTVLIEHFAGSHVKVLVLEGDLRVALNARFGESTVLTPGKMLIISDGETRLPQPVAVDLARVVKTSALIDGARFQTSLHGSAAPLPSLDAIEKQISRQSVAKSKARLAETNLLIEGAGTSVMVASKETMEALNAATSRAPITASPLATAPSQVPDARVASAVPFAEPALPAPSANRPGSVSELGLGEPPASAGQ